MIDMRQAVQTAVTSVESLYPQAKDIRLEEIEPRGDILWSVVLSFKSGEPTTLASVMGSESRLFKRLEIDKSTGTLEALKVWKQ